MSEITAKRPTPAPDAAFGHAWVLAARPRTLPVALGPVAVGTAVAIADAGARWLPALAAAACALLLQIGSNLANDAFDFEKGADGGDRLGPPRAAQLGLLTPRQLKQGMSLALGAAFLVGLYLVAEAGWPILLLGVASIVAAVTYTGGRWAYGYRGLGDPMVFLFFGVAAVMGTHYVQTLTPSMRALAASLPVGALASAILVVNNLRDIEGDERANKRTLAVRLGRGGARAEYVSLLAAAYAALPAFFWLGGHSAWIFLPLLTLPLAIARVKTVGTCEDGPRLNAALVATAQLGLAFNLLLALGWVL